jgi:hypothetical protein
VTAKVDRPWERGVALPMALWAAMALALLAAGIAATADLSLRRQSLAGELAAARALRETGLSLGVMLAVHPDPSRRLPPDGTQMVLTEPEGSITLRLWDEAGRMDLNLTPSGTILSVAGRLLPAEEGAALAAALDRQRALGERWHSVLELGAILSPDSFTRLYPLLTVHGPAMQGGQVSLRSMPPALRTLWPGLSAVEADDAVALAARGVTSSGLPASLFTLRIEARTVSGAVSGAEAVVWITVQGPQAFRILEWRDPAPELSSMDTGA